MLKNIEISLFSGTVTKHLTVLGELSKLVATRNLLEISEIEQQLASGGEHSHCLATVRRLLQHEQTTDLVIFSSARKLT